MHVKYMLLKENDFLSGLSLMVNLLHYCVSMYLRQEKEKLLLAVNEKKDVNKRGARERMKERADKRKRQDEEKH
jgi:hypothetical protein